MLGDYNRQWFDAQTGNPIPGPTVGTPSQARQPSRALGWLSALGPLLQMWLSHRGQKLDREQRKKLAQQAQQHNIDMWEMHADYNSPQAQMQRLMQAGLNPNIVYGQGTAGATGQMQGKPEAVVPELPQHQLSASAQHVPDMIEQFMKLYKLTTESRKHSQQVADIRKKDAERGYTEVRTFKANIDAQIWQAIQKDYINQMKAQAEHARTRAEREKYLKRISAAEAELSESLKEIGAATGDHYTIRLMALLLRTLGITKDDLLSPSFKGPGTEEWKDKRQPF